MRPFGYHASSMSKSKAPRSGAEIVREWREAHRLTHRAAAELLGVSHTFQWKVEQGDKRPALENLKLWWEITGAPPQSFYPEAAELFGQDVTVDKDGAITGGVAHG